MYENFFQLNSRPFLMAPYVDHFYEGESVKQAIDLLKKCISNDLGLALLMGEPGTGKSLVLAILEREYNQQFPVGSLVCSRLGNRHELLQSISFELGLTYRGLSEGELRLGLLDYLRKSESCPHGVLLLIDEAHNLPSELLDELRLLANFARHGQPQVRAVLAGGLRLEDNVADPRLESFNQRIGGRCWLTNLKRSETEAYVLDHLNRVGRDGNEIFEPCAFRSIYELTDGCPRYINQLCNEALTTACQNSEPRIDSNLITETWAKLQNLPGDHFCKTRLVFNPAETHKLDENPNVDIEGCAAFEEHNCDAVNMIEFGTLDDDQIENSEVLETIDKSSELLPPDSLPSGAHTSESQAADVRIPETQASEAPATDLLRSSFDEPHEQQELLDAEREVSLPPSNFLDQQSQQDWALNSDRGFDESQLDQQSDQQSNCTVDQSEIDEIRIGDVQDMSLDLQTPAEDDSECQTNENSDQSGFQTPIESGDSVPIEFVESSVSTPELESEESKEFVQDFVQDGDSPPQETDSTEQELVDESCNSVDSVPMESLVNLESTAQVDDDDSSEQATHFCNPFDEGFADEERILDFYGPLIAAQNRSSLDVTPNDLQLLNDGRSSLEHLMEIDEQADDSPEFDVAQTNLTETLAATTEVNDNADDRDRITDSAQQEAAALIQNLCETLGESPASFVLDDVKDVPHETDQFEPTTALENSAYSELRSNSAHESNDDTSWGTNHASIWFNKQQPAEADVSTDEMTQLEAVRDEIESQNRFSAQAFANYLPIQQSSDAAEDSFQYAVPQDALDANGDRTESFPTETSDSGSLNAADANNGWSFRPYCPDDDDLHSGSHPSAHDEAGMPINDRFLPLNNQETSRSLPTIDTSNQGETIPAASTDDREIIVCELDGITDFESQSNMTRRPPVISLTPVSTGKAVCMDYQELFEQLRNLPRD